MDPQDDFENPCIMQISSSADNYIQKRYLKRIIDIKDIFHVFFQKIEQIGASLNPLNVKQTYLSYKLAIELNKQHSVEDIKESSYYIQSLLERKELFKSYLESDYGQKNTFKKWEIKKWDYISTFTPPSEINGSFEYLREMLEQLDKKSEEFFFVSYKFKSTFKYQPQNENFQKFDRKHLPNITDPEIIKIEKVHNKVIYNRFLSEFQRMIEKYRDKSPSELVKHLFHGSRKTDPEFIIESEFGFDFRFSKSGLYGQGIYFADNSEYSHQFAYVTKYNECQMFLSLVLVGDSIETHPGDYRMPPPKYAVSPERYDSITHSRGHYIVYDNLKSYPGYLMGESAS